VASRSIVIRRPVAEVFAVIRDVARAPEWSTFEVVEEAPPQRLVTRIADEDLPFAGSWTYELTPAGEGATRITVTERGEVKPVVFRALSKYVFTHHRTLEQYLRALAARFGERADFDAHK